MGNKQVRTEEKQESKLIPASVYGAPFKDYEIFVPHGTNERVDILNDRQLLDASEHYYYFHNIRDVFYFLLNRLRGNDLPERSILTLDQVRKAGKLE